MSAESVVITVIGSSVAEPGCLSRISEPNFSNPDPGSKSFRIPDLDPHQRISVFLALKTVEHKDQGVSQTVAELINCNWCITL
jgi:hypothetical protein